MDASIDAGMFSYLIPAMLCLTRPDQVYKASKVDSGSSVRTNGRATFEDEDDLANVEAGPELPMEEEEEAPNDEDGRFFGGGVTKGTAEVLDFIEERDGEALVSRQGSSFNINHLKVLVIVYREI